MLQVVSNMDRAGIETMLMNYYRHIDRKEIQFDFLCNKSKPGAYDDEIISLGGKIFHTPGLNPFKYFQYLKYMKQLFSLHPEYTIIHAHNDAFVTYSLFAAKMNLIKNRIAHVHSAAFTFDYKWPLKVVCRFFIKKVCSQKWACGEKAALFYYGSLSDVHIHNNAIEVQQYVYNESDRVRIREKYQLQDNIVIGHIGRFMKQKNHSFLIDIFKEIHEREPRAKLVLLGDGVREKMIKKKVHKMSLDESVMFVGNVGNAREWYQAFDLFLLPSIWEGLPLVGIEAQASDLPCVFSSDVTKEVQILPTSIFLSRKLSCKIWAEKCLDLMRSPKTRCDRTIEIQKAGFDIEIEAKKLELIYKSMR